MIYTGECHIRKRKGNSYLLALTPFLNGENDIPVNVEPMSAMVCGEVLAFFYFR